MRKSASAYRTDGVVWVRVQQAVVGRNEVVLLSFRNARAKSRPLLGKEPAGFVVEPVHIDRPRHRDRGENHLRDALWVLLGVGQRERHPPRTAPQQPPLDAEMFAQLLDVGDEVVRRVVLEAYRWIRDGRRAASATALVELDDAVRVGIEQPPAPGRTAATR